MCTEAARAPAPLPFPLIASARLLSPPRTDLPRCAARFVHRLYTASVPPPSAQTDLGPAASARVPETRA